MSDYFECTKVGLEFLDQTRNVFKAEEIVAATPEQIFEVFEVERDRIGFGGMRILKV